MFPLVSIIIPNFNGKHLLSSCLESLFSCGYPNFEVIVVDNGSEDGSVAWVDRHFSKVRVIALDKNLGYGGAINIGARKAKGKYLLFLNNDVRVGKDFLVPLVSCLEDDEKLAAVQPRIYLSPSRHSELDSESNRFGSNKILKRVQDDGECWKRDVLESTGSYFNLTGFLEYLNVENRGGENLEPQEVFSVTGAAMILRRDLFEKLEGFDKDFFLYSEDHDFCWRLKSLGFKIKFIPDSVVYHRRGATSGKLPGKTVLYYSFRNRLMTILKNLDWRYLPVVIPIHLGFSFLGSLALLMTGRFRKSVAVLRGILWNFIHLPVILEKRAEVSSRKKIPDAKIVGFKKNIPVSYLVRQLVRYVC